MDEIHQENNYIFVSYAHKDAETVLPLIDALRKKGFSVWYDQGIEAGTEWPEYIAERIEKCGVFLACISPASMQSNNCRNEINFALSLKKDCLTVYLEDTKMTAGMQLQLGSLQALFKNRHKTDESFYKALTSATLLQGLQAIPAPVEKKVSPVLPTPKAVEETAVAEALNKEKTDTITLLWLLFFAILIAVDYTTMWLSTSYIKNGFLMVICATFPVLILGAIFMRYTHKRISHFSKEGKSGVVNVVCVLVFMAFLLSLIGDCFFIFCAEKVIFKILISLGVNLLRYFVILGCLPDDSKKE